MASPLFNSVLCLLLLLYPLTSITMKEVQPKIPSTPEGHALDEAQRKQLIHSEESRYSTDVLSDGNDRPGVGEPPDRGLRGNNECTMDGVTDNICSICWCDLIKRGYIDCSGRGLPSVPNCLPNTTVGLDLSNNNISEIYEESFGNLTQLKKLNLNNISLTRLHPNAFDNLPSLTFLDMSRNTKFPMTNWTTDRDLFKGLQQLKELRMYGNTQYLSRGTYPDEALSELVSLQELWIDGLHNRAFGPGFKSLKALKTVYMSGILVRQNLAVRYCSTDILHGTLDNLEMVQNLTIRGCYIRYIHPDAFNNTKALKYLDLSDNKALELAGVTPALKSLAKTKIEILKLNHIYDRMYNNCGVVLTNKDIEGTKELKHLKELHFEYNSIVSLEHRVFRTLPENLDFLNVRNNEFQLGNYLFYTQEMRGVRKLDLSYQNFANLLWQNEKSDLFESNHRRIRSYSGDDANVLDLKGDGKTKKSGTDMESENADEHVKYFGKGDETFSSESIDERKSVFQDIRPHHYGFEGSFHDYLDTELRHQQGMSDDEDDDTPVCKQLPNNILQIVTPNLPPNLTDLDFSFSKLAHPIFRFKLSNNNNLRTVNLSQCMLYCWDGPIIGVEKLEYLNLQMNFCTSIRRSFFDSFPNLTTLIISNNLLNLNISHDKDGRLLRNLMKLRELDMSYNRLDSIPDKFLMNQANLTRLNISHNLLNSINLTVKHMVQLQMLDLSRNSIFAFDKSFQKNLIELASKTHQNTNMPLTIQLTDNKLHCFCQNLHFVRWLKESNCTFLNIHVTSCILENETEIDISNEHNLINVISLLEKQCTSYFALAASMTALLFCIVNSIVAVIVYRYRWRIRYWYYVTKRDMRSRRSGYQPLLSMSSSGDHALISGVHKYHAYISSTESDRDFVLDNLMPFLREKRLRLCVPEVDFVPGQNLYRMISNAIHSSKVTIFVVSSESFFDNEWEIAMRMAQQESLTRGRQSFFAIFVEEIPMRRVCTPKWIDIGNMYRNDQFIVYPSQAQAQELELFWNDCTRWIRESE